MELFDEILVQTSDEEDFYKILGCNELSNTEQIITEYRLKAKQFHPDKNVTKPDTTKEFVKLQVAKDVLTDTKLRKEYDTWRRSGMKISFKRWLSMKDSLKMSMHWATPVNKTPMIESKLPAESPQTSKKEDTEEDFSETLRKFRNYDI